MEIEDLAGEHEISGLDQIIHVVDDLYLGWLEVRVVRCVLDGKVYAFVPGKDRRGLVHSSRLQEEPIDRFPPRRIKIVVVDDRSIIKKLGRDPSLRYKVSQDLGFKGFVLSESSWLWWNRISYFLCWYWTRGVAFLN